MRGRGRAGVWQERTAQNSGWIFAYAAALGFKVVLHPPKTDTMASSPGFCKCILRSVVCHLVFLSSVSSYFSIELWLWSVSSAEWWLEPLLYTPSASPLGRGSSHAPDEPVSLQRRSTVVTFLLMHPVGTDRLPPGAASSL